MSWGTPVLAAVLVFVLSAHALAQADQCTVELKSEARAAHVAVESCDDVGVFALGGSYAGAWETLTYRYPRPWEGTFLTVAVDGTFYATSRNPRNEVSLDAYLEAGPTVIGDAITVSWLLPEGVRVTQTFTLEDNGTAIEVGLENVGDASRIAGARLHVDTMLGDNDGAPIYIPGDGLLSTEASYEGDRLDFRYWQAYNRIEDPSIVAWGALDPARGMTYPTRVAVANWKQSNTGDAWAYDTDASVSILGDSALLLYYAQEPLGAGESRTIAAAVGSERPLTEQAGTAGFGITELIPDAVSGRYCPGTPATVKVDVLSIRETHHGMVTLAVTNSSGATIYGDSRQTGLVEADDVSTLAYAFVVPEGEDAYRVTAMLADADGAVLDEKSIVIEADLAACPPDTISAGKIVGTAMSVFLVLLPLGLLALFLLAAVGIAAWVVVQRRKGLSYPAIFTGGSVHVEKAKEGDTATVTVTNDTRRILKDVVVEDAIPQSTEVDVQTIGVVRRGGDLVWRAGDLLPGGSIILEYTIKGVHVLPAARVAWDAGEQLSN